MNCWLNITDILLGTCNYLTDKQFESFQKQIKITISNNKITIINLDETEIIGIKIEDKFVNVADRYKNKKIKEIYSIDNKWCGGHFIIFDDNSIQKIIYGSGNGYISGYLGYLSAV